jgi:hypothetical protein
VFNEDTHDPDFNTYFRMTLFLPLSFALYRALSAVLAENFHRAFREMREDCSWVE